MKTERLENIPIGEIIDSGIEERIIDYIASGKKLQRGDLAILRNEYKADFNEMFGKTMAEIKNLPTVGDRKDAVDLLSRKNQIYRIMTPFAVEEVMDGAPVGFWIDEVPCSKREKVWPSVGDGYFAIFYPDVGTFNSNLDNGGYVEVEGVLTTFKRQVDAKFFAFQNTKIPTEFVTGL